MFVPSQSVKGVDYIFQGNILLDSELHCQITDFGTIQHFESTAARATTVFVKYAAPELFGTCTACGSPECDDERHRAIRGKTMETDVFSFGGVYYSVSSNFPQFTRVIEAHRHSSILFLFMGKTTFKWCNLSWMECGQIG